MNTLARQRLARFALLAPLTLFAAFLIAIAFRADRAPSLAGRPVPAFDLPGLDALHPGLAAADLKHGKPTLVVFFASWCGPCRSEMPRLATLAAEGRVVHGIAVQDQPRDLTRFLKANGNPFRRIGLDDQGSLIAALGPVLLPQTLVIDGHGIIRARHMGALTPAELTQVRAELQP